MQNHNQLFPDPPANIHFIGIKGVGMTGLAGLLSAQGYVVSGSDTNEPFQTDAVLSALNIFVAEEFNKEHITKNIDAVIYSTAYREDHTEREAARACGIPEWSYPEALGLFAVSYKNSVAVAGSHGKTTTAALLSVMLEEGGLDPTALVGAPVNIWGRNSRSGSGDWFVFEADEYQNKFQYYTPTHTIVTNVDYDHPDFFKTESAYRDVFEEFVKRLPSSGTLVLNGDDRNSQGLMRSSTVQPITFGEGEHNDWRLVDVKVDQGKTSFRVMREGVEYGEFSLQFPGKHYALDALVAMVLADRAGVSVQKIQRALTHYSGTARRFEVKGKCGKMIVIDDYAHHPAEISSVIRAVREGYKGQRIVVVFQAHTYSRTEQLLGDFAAALALADAVIIPPIYASQRESKGTVDHAMLVAAINAEKAGRAVGVGSLDEAITMAKKETDVGILLTMGAGDVWRVATDLVG